MTLDIPESIVLSDGTKGQVKRVEAKVIDGQLTQIVYTVEKDNGAWAEMTSEEVQPQPAST